MDQARINAFNEEQRLQAEKQADQNLDRQNAASISQSVVGGANKVASEVSNTTQETKKVAEAVNNSGQKVIDSLASAQGDIAQALNNLVVATVVSKDPQLLQASRDVAMLLKSISQAGDSFKGSKLNLLPAANDKLASSIDKLAQNITSEPEKDYTPQLQAIQKQLSKLDVKPVVNVPKTDVNVDLKPLLDAVTELQAAVKDSKVTVPEVDFTKVITGLSKVQSTIANLSFPSSNYVLPFMSQTGKAVQVKLNDDGTVPTSATISTSGLALDATLTGVIRAEDTASADADKGIGALAIRKATPANTSGTDGDYEYLQVSAGRLWASTVIDTALPAGTALIGKVGIDQTTPGTTNAVSIAQLGANTIATGNGASSTGVQRVAQVNDGTGVLAAVTNVATIGTSVTPGTGATNLGKAEDAVHTTGDVGVAILGIRDDTLNATSGTEGDYEMFHTTAEGAVWVTQAPSITNGWATFNATSGDGSTALTATAQQVKATTGTVGGWYIYNPNSSATYVNFYNSTSAGVTVGTTNQQMVICVPATAGANVEFGNGITFATAISISATTTGGGNTAPATALECNVFYK